jgi:hypothetical protein
MDGGVKAGRRIFYHQVEKVEEVKDKEGTLKKLIRLLLLRGL